MRICVSHETVYRYDIPPSGVMQVLRLTPRNYTGQYVVNWRIDVSTDCRLEPLEDAFGNIAHAFSASGPISELRLLANGEVETQDTAGVVRGAVERFLPSLFLRETALTRADDAILAYAAQFGRPATLSVLHDLLIRAHDDLDFDAELVTTNAVAAETFAAKRGTCQDLAHVFIAVARALGVPARYVSGYLHRPDAVAAADGAHAWAEAHVPDLGWVGFDPASGLCVTDRYIRVAIGLDSLGAAWVRGAHYGGGREEAVVKLRVTQASWQTQG